MWLAGMVPHAAVTAAGRDVSVVVCAYTERRWHELEAAVASVRAQTLQPREILLVVDHNPALVTRAETELPEVAVLPSSGRPGLAGARNTGSAAAQGSIVAFLDDDAVADADWLERLAEAYQNEDVVGAGGEVSPIWSSGRPQWFPPEFDWVVGCTYRGMPTVTTPVRNVIGANMSFRRTVFEYVQFFPGLGHAHGQSLGGEETDFCIRLRQLWPEQTIVYEPRARVRHHVPPDRGRWGYFIRRCYNEGLSKGILTRRVGRRPGLASERAYTLRALPSALPRAVADAGRHRKPGVVLQIPVVMTGLAVTTLGYVMSLGSRRSSMS